MPEKITIALEAEVLRWWQREAADKSVSVSNLIGTLLEKEMFDAYWCAYEGWKRLPDNLGAPEPIDASHRFTRDEAHERR